jgi:hypothetical protein
MGAQMNIKSDEAYAIASELARQEGASLTQVVLDALRARQRELSKAKKIEEVMQLCREAAAMMSPELRALDIDEYLYDENGLPK